MKQKLDKLDKDLPKPVPAVSNKGRMGPQGWLPENWAWRDVLCPINPETLSREGAHPMQLDTRLLSAAGHPRRTSFSAIPKPPDGIVSEARSFKTIRQHCLLCAENRAEVRRCATIECSFWPYRMGKNPHNPQRGRKPPWLSGNAKPDAKEIAQGGVSEQVDPPKIAETKTHETGTFNRSQP